MERKRESPADISAIKNGAVKLLKLAHLSKDETSPTTTTYPNDRYQISQTAASVETEKMARPSTSVTKRNIFHQPESMMIKIPSQSSKPENGVRHDTNKVSPKVNAETKQPSYGRPDILEALVPQTIPKCFSGDTSVLLKGAPTFQKGSDNGDISMNAAAATLRGRFLCLDPNPSLHPKILPETSTTNPSPTTKHPVFVPALSAHLPSNIRPTGKLCETVPFFGSPASSALVADERKTRSRERNRLHAKKTRERKKLQMQGLQIRIKQLQQEEEYLRKKLEERDTAQALLCMSGKSNAPKTDPNSSNPPVVHFNDNLESVLVELQKLDGYANLDAEHEDEDIKSTAKHKLSVQERQNIRRERNRMHAKRTRDRKKLFFEASTLIIRRMEQENTKLSALLGLARPGGAPPPPSSSSSAPPPGLSAAVPYQVDISSMAAELAAGPLTADKLRRMAAASAPFPTGHRPPPPPPLPAAAAATGAPPLHPHHPPPLAAAATAAGGGAPHSHSSHPHHRACSYTSQNFNAFQNKPTWAPAAATNPEATVKREGDRGRAGGCLLPRDPPGMMAAAQARGPQGAAAAGLLLPFPRPPPPPPPPRPPLPAGAAALPVPPEATLPPASPTAEDCARGCVATV